MNTAFSNCHDVGAGVYLKHFWQNEGNPDYQVERILPKGEIEIIFNFGETVCFRRTAKGEGATSRCFINGISNLPVTLFMPQQQHFFGVVLQPAAVKKLLSAPSGLFLNAITDLELVDKRFTELWHQLAECKNFEEKTLFVQQWVLDRFSAIHQQERVLSNILDSGVEVTSVANLAATVCYSTRQLHRKVQELFGMSSELLLSYRRYKQALHRLHENNETLTRIAYTCGYYDQAHFNHEFKEYTGLTPGAYRQQCSHLPGHLYE